MSYSILEARGERAAETQKAIKDRDEDKLFQLAKLYKTEGDEEYAETLVLLAHKARRENWAYDEARDEALITELA